ncbi:hypothetical protein BH23VER1_BH23VER1_29240 [soil metagenome]
MHLVQHHLSDRLTIGTQPDTDDLKRLRDEGFSSIVNLRSADETGHPLIDPLAEEAAVREQGMGYVNYPVSLSELDPAMVDAFGAAIEDLTAPIFVHCRGGKRSGALALMHIAIESGWTGDEALRKGEEAGYSCDDPKLVSFMRSYIDARRAAPPSGG